MKTKGFTLVELMVVIAVLGILSAIAVPKFFGQTSKAKAAEVTPAAMSYITLQKAYLMEKQSVGTWKKIGYSAPKSNGNFAYTKGEVKSTVRKKDIKSTFSGNGQIGWMAENVTSLDNCSSGNKWVVSIIAHDETNIEYKTQLVQSSTSQHCIALTGSTWGSVNIQVASNTNESSETSAPTPTPTTESNVEEEELGNTNNEQEETELTQEQQTYKNCSQGGNTSWLHGAKNSSGHADCNALRDALEKSGDLVCTNSNHNGCNNYAFASAEAECRVTGNNCN